MKLCAVQKMSICTSPENDILILRPHVKGVFNDTSGWDSDSEDVLKVRYVWGLWNPIQICEIAKKKNMQGEKKTLRKEKYRKHVENLKCKPNACSYMRVHSLVGLSREMKTLLQCKRTNTFCFSFDQICISQNSKNSKPKKSSSLFIAIVRGSDRDYIQQDFCSSISRHSSMWSEGTPPSAWILYSFNNPVNIIWSAHTVKDHKCLILTIWWSRTAGTPCADHSTPVFQDHPTDSWQPWRGCYLSPSPYPPPPPGLRWHGSMDTQRRQKDSEVTMR